MQRSEHALGYLKARMLEAFLRLTAGSNSEVAAKRSFPPSGDAGLSIAAAAADSTDAVKARGNREIESRETLSIALQTCFNSEHWLPGLEALGIHEGGAFTRFLPIGISLF